MSELCLFRLASVDAHGSDAYRRTALTRVSPVPLRRRPPEYDAYQIILCYRTPSQICLMDKWHFGFSFRSPRHFFIDSVLDLSY